MSHGYSAGRDMVVALRLLARRINLEKTHTNVHITFSNHMPKRGTLMTLSTGLHKTVISLAT